MANEQTAHFGFDKVGAGGSLREQGYKPLVADRDTMDRLFYLFGRHHHDGSVLSSDAPVYPPSLILDSSFGDFSSGARVYYRYTLVDANGVESGPSPEVFVDTPNPIVAPASPTPSFTPTGGTLLPGPYLYVLSAYRDASNYETVASPPIGITVTGATSNNKITLQLPALPSGGEGFNVYRRRQGAAHYEHLATIDMTVVSPPTEFVDDGSYTPDPGRAPQRQNMTNSHNQITITLPGATPAVPLGYTWKIYRTTTPGDYGASFLRHVVEETTETSGIITPTFTDVGIRTRFGGPPTSGLSISMPEPVQLTDGAEVQGSLPPSMVAYADAIEFRVAGALTVANGVATWRCHYDAFVVTEVLATLGKNKSPAASDVIVDVNRRNSSAATPTWATIFTTQANRPRVPVGANYGSSAVPDVVALVRDDLLSVDIDQIGGGANTDTDLLVQVIGYGWKDLTASVAF